MKSKIKAPILGLTASEETAHLTHTNEYMKNRIFELRRMI